MEFPLDFVDRYIFAKCSIYPSDWTEDFWLRQSITLCLIFYLGGFFTYFTFCSFNYFFIFDHRLMRHPLFLKNQVRREIKQSMVSAVPLVVLFSIVTLPELHGYSKLYTFDEIGATGSQALFLSIRDIIGLILFGDCLIYWIHRFMHHRNVYRYIHKPHHVWKVPTPFACYAFHPLDGFLQSAPYHLYPYLFPLNKHIFLLMFVVVNLWTISIHDGDYRVPEFLRPFINGSAHHTDHHLYYNYNYGQYFTFWDRIGGSYRNPSAYEGISLADAAISRKCEETRDEEDEYDGYEGKMHKG